MSGQDVGFFDVGTDCLDIVIENGDLKADNGLDTAAFISLFSDRRVTLEELPAGEDDRKGWWADLISEPIDDEIGSKLWTLERSKINNATAAELETILEEAFKWMLDDGISNSVVVTAEQLGINEIRGSVEISKPDGSSHPFKFIWDGQRLKISEV